MTKDTENLIPLYRFSNLGAFSNIEHFVTTRKGGFSSKPFDELNLSTTVGDDSDIVNGNRKLVQLILKSESDIIFPEQIHEDGILVADATTTLADCIGKDAVITNVCGFAIGVLSADCVPVVLYDPVRQVIGVAHAGWRGTVKQIAAKTAVAMNAHFQSFFSDIRVGIGPSIGPDSYVVGDEVVLTVKREFPKDANQLLRYKDGLCYFDLWRANIVQLIDVGVLDKHIEIAGVDTSKSSDEFFSYRNSGGKTGRFGAFVILQSDQAGSER